jgi:hypothetical protein
MKGLTMNKIEMKTKYDSAKKFVETHKTKIALATGIAVGATAALVVKYQIDKDKVCLEVTNREMEHMKSGGGVTYETKLGDIYAITEDFVRVRQQEKE